jgi:hypothetical protein
MTAETAGQQEHATESYVVAQFHDELGSPQREY